MSGKFGAIISDSKKTQEDKSSTFVTLEMFKLYHKNLMDYIGMHDDLMLDGETTCPKCGATITSDKCEHCVSNKTEE